MTCPNCDPELNSADRVIKTNKELNRCTICGDNLIGRVGTLRPMKRVLILGIDGYIGWPLALHLLHQGYIVSGIDSGVRRLRVSELGSNSLTPIKPWTSRKATLKEFPNYYDLPAFLTLHGRIENLSKVLSEFNPDSIIHLAEQPSASWSMRSSDDCAITQYENVIGTLKLLWAIKQTCPKTHLIKLGTMGEYGTPDCVIPEGMIPKDCIGYHELSQAVGRPCPMQGLPFPKSPHSFYHLSKVHDTNNIIFACKTWGLTSTDIMQGIVFGLISPDPNLVTRFDYDEHFGTVINRFVAQAISNHPLTIYGTGQQIRGFLPLKDSIQCINLIIDNPPLAGSYRTLNQFESNYSLNNLANIVFRRSKLLGLQPSIMHINNPRTEKQKHTYKPVHTGLHELGYKPTTDIKHEIHNLISSLSPYSDRVNHSVILPKTTWR